MNRPNGRDETPRGCFAFMDVRGGVDFRDYLRFDLSSIGPALVAFLQARLNDGGLATFILSNDDDVDRGFGLASKENATEAYRPVSSIVTASATVSESSILWTLGVGAGLALARRRTARRRGAAAQRRAS